MFELCLTCVQEAEAFGQSMSNYDLGYNEASSREIGLGKQVAFTFTFTIVLIRVVLTL